MRDRRIGLFSICLVSLMLTGWFDPCNSIDADRFGTAVAGTGSVSATGGLIKCTSPNSASGAIIFPKIAIDKSKSQLWRFEFSQTTQGGPLLHIIDRVSDPVISDHTSVLAETRIRVALTNQNPANLQMRYYNASHSLFEWNGSAWVSGSQNAFQAGVSNYVILILEIDAPNARWRLMAGGRRQTTTSVDQGLKISTITSWVSFSGIESSDNLKVVIGDPYTSTASGTVNIESIAFMDGEKVYAWANAKNAAVGNYDIVPLYGYKDPDGVCRFFVRPNTSTKSVTNAKDPWVVRDSDGTLTMFYRDGNQNIGRATAPDENSQLSTSWTLRGIAVAKGANESLGFPAAVRLPNEPDPNKRVQLLISAGDSSSPHPSTEIHLVTAPSFSGPYTRQGVVIQHGGVGNPDEYTATGPVPIYHNGQWEVWYTGGKPNSFDPNRATQQSGLRATGPSVDQLTKDGQSPRLPHLDAVQAINNNLQPGRFPTMNDTSGFELEQPVYIKEQNTDWNSWVESRVRAITPDVEIELNHLVANIIAVNNPRIWGAGAGNQQIREILPRNDGGWEFYCTVFNFASQEDVTLVTSFQEETFTAGHPGPDPSSQNPVYTWNRNPITLRGQSGDQRSIENISILHEATVIVVPVSRVDRISVKWPAGFL